MDVKKRGRTSSPKGNIVKEAAPTSTKTRATRTTRVEKVVASNVFRLGYLIHDVARMRRTVFDYHMKSEGLTRSQWWILANLSRHEGDSIVSSELAKLLDVGKVTLGGLLDRLEVSGYVYRHPDKKDRRAKQIFITKAGYATIARMRVIAEDLNKRISAGLSEEQIREMESNLTLIKDNIREMLAEGADGLSSEAD